MSLLARFEKQLADRGLSIIYEGGDRFSLKGPNDEKTPEVIAACRAMKKSLLDKYAPKADDPANAVDAVDVVPLAGQPSYVSDANPTNAPSVTATGQGWTTCGVCQADVNPMQLGTLSFAMWMQFCGKEETKQGGVKQSSRCPYRPRSDS